MEPGLWALLILIPVAICALFLYCLYRRYSRLKKRDRESINRDVMSQSLGTGGPADRTGLEPTTYNSLWDWHQSTHNINPDNPIDEYSSDSYTIKEDPSDHVPRRPRTKKKKNPEDMISEDQPKRPRKKRKDVDEIISEDAPKRPKKKKMSREPETVLSEDAPKRPRKKKRPPDDADIDTRRRPKKREVDTEELSEMDKKPKRRKSKQSRRGNF